MHKCCNKDFSKITYRGSKEALNIHYYSWGYLFAPLRKHIHKYLDNWLRNSNSIAIWIETGSHDFAHNGYEYTMEIGLKHFNQTLEFIKNRARNSSARVDLRVLASPPMPDGWYLNNFAISALNAKLQMICLEHDVNYLDAFSIEVPCANDVPKLLGTKNHYFHRFGNQFDGKVGKNLYFGEFFQQICTRQTQR